MKQDVHLHGGLSQQPGQVRDKVVVADKRYQQVRLTIAMVGNSDRLDWAAGRDCSANQTRMKFSDPFSACGRALRKNQHALPLSQSFSQRLLDL